MASASTSASWSRQPAWLLASGCASTRGPIVWRARRVVVTRGGTSTDDSVYTGAGARGCARPAWNEYESRMVRGDPCSIGARLIYESRGAYVSPRLLYARATNVARCAVGSLRALAARTATGAARLQLHWACPGARNKQYGTGWHGWNPTPVIGVRHQPYHRSVPVRCVLLCGACNVKATQAPFVACCFAVRAM